MTRAQQNRISGFNASLSQRGVLVKLDGTESTYTMLVEDVGKGNSDFEITEDQRVFTKLHVLRTVPNLSKICNGMTLLELDPATNLQTGREFQVTSKESHDIKIVFDAVVNYRDESPTQ